MFIEEVSMAKRIKKDKSVIVLNAMYSGKYLNDNMGHEIINLFILFAILTSSINMFLLDVEAQRFVKFSE